MTAGNPVRINVTLEVGAAHRARRGRRETTLLQTDKADLHTELTSKEITNLPLNQYRNYQALMNLVPGATPAQFQNAEIDTPGRSLRTWVNGTQPNSNATRIDGAVSVNIWLPHHVGYVQPAETIETVNISTNNFDADLRHGRRRGVDGHHQVGHQPAARLGLLSSATATSSTPTRSSTTRSADREDRR